jgi:hypothetical protein
MRLMQEMTRRNARKEMQTTRKLDPGAVGLTSGVLWGLGLFSLTWWIIAFEGASKKPTGMGKLYRGYTISPRGSFIGLVWGFFDALIGGACFAWLYNWLAGLRKAR